MLKHMKAWMAVAATTILVGLWLPAGAHAGPRSSRSTTECVTAPSVAQNVTLDCPSEYALPTHETSVAVDPSDPDHVVSASIDGTFGDQTIEFATTFDGGTTWTIGDIPHGPNTQDFDPGVAFDAKRGTVLITFEYEGQDSTYCVPLPEHTAQLVTTSSDGGLHWSDPIEAFTGRGCFGYTQNVLLFGAEVKIAASNDAASPSYGRIWLTGTLTDCRPCHYHGISPPFPIAEIHSDDGGITWTKPEVISGENAQFCTSAPNPPQCDASQPTTPVLVAPDGSVYLAFANLQHKQAWELDEIGEVQIMVIRSTDGGATWSPPVHVVDLEDGCRDYDCTAGTFGIRLTGINLYPAGETSDLVAAPEGTLYLAFFDNRNGLHDVAHPVSNTDVFIMSSTDNGQTWTGPDLVSNAPGDQVNVNLAVNPATGELGAVFYDRSADPRGKSVNLTLATGLPGDFEQQTVTTAPSHLSQDLWNQATLSDCFECVFHLGDYIGLAYGSDGAANVTWADLRHFTTTPTGRTGYAMNVDFARVEGDRP